MEVFELKLESLQFLFFNSEFFIQFGHRLINLILGKADVPKRSRCVTVEAIYAKNKKLRHIPLTDEGVTFFRTITEGRRPDEPMFVRANGQAWDPSEQHRPMKGATEAEDIDICFHGLRHTRITQLIEELRTLRVKSFSKGILNE